MMTKKLKEILNEFNYNLNSSGIHLLKLRLISSRKKQKIQTKQNIKRQNQVKKKKKKYIGKIYAFECPKTKKTIPSS